LNVFKSKQKIHSFLVTDSIVVHSNYGRPPAPLKLRHSATELLKDVISPPIFHHSVWSVISAHKLTLLKRGDRQRLAFVCYTCVQVERGVDHGHKLSTFQHDLT